MQSTERWLPVVGYEGLYEVSDHGRVKRVAAGKGARAGRILKDSPNTNGHMQVDLYRSGKRKIYQTHRLVMEAFVGPCPDGLEGCHNDGNPSNNHISNLRWDTRSSNIFDRVKHGTHNMARKTRCNRGHALVVPNLKPSGIARGSRACLACSRADSFARNNGIEFDQRIADDRYARIRGTLTEV